MKRGQTALATLGLLALGAVGKLAVDRVRSSGHPSHPTTPAADPATPPQPPLPTAKPITASAGPGGLLLQHAPAPRPHHPARKPVPSQLPLPAPPPAPLVEAPAAAPVAPPAPAAAPPPAPAPPAPAPPHIFTPQELLKLLIQKGALEEAPAAPEGGLKEPELSPDPTFRNGTNYLANYALYGLVLAVTKTYGPLCRTDSCVTTLIGLEKGAVSEGQRVMNRDFDDHAAGPRRYQTIMTARGKVEKSLNADLERYLLDCEQAGVCE